MTQQPTPQTERHASSRDARDVFLDALRQVCYLSPEQEQAIYKRMQDNNEFYVATGRDAAPFLEVVLERHQEKHASLNICHYGNMRTGKSLASLFIASTFDPTFTVDHVVFDLAQMQILLPHTTPGSIYIVDDVRERYGLGSKSEVVNTQTFLETAAKSGTCLIFNSPTVKFTTGLKYFLEFLGYCDTFSLAIVYAKAILFKNDRQVETLDPIGFIKFPKPTHLQPLIDAYEAKKDIFIAEIRKKAGGSGTNIIDARIDYIRSEVDFSQCSELQDIQDEIILWDHTLPSNLVGAMARKIRRFLRTQSSPVPTGTTERAFSVIIDGWEGEAPSGLLIDLINMVDWSGKEEIRFTYESVMLEGRNPEWVAQKLNKTQRTIYRYLGEADRLIGEAFERYLEKNQPQLWERRGGHGEPDLINEEYCFVVSAKVMRGDIKKIQTAIERSTAELAWVAKGFTGFLILFLSNKNRIYIRVLTDRQTPDQPIGLGSPLPSPPRAAEPAAAASTLAPVPPLATPPCRGVSHGG